MKKLKKLFVNKSVIKNLHSKKMFGFAAVSAGFAALSQQTQAQVIIQDTFTTGSNYGAYMLSASPSPTNVPGDTFRMVAQGKEQSKTVSSTKSVYDIGTVTDYSRETHNGAVAISLTSGGPSTDPAGLTLSAGVYAPLDTTNGGISTTGFLGVTNAAGASGSDYGGQGYTGDGFTGLGIETSGAVDLMIAGVVSSTGLTTTFDSNGFAALSFDLNYNSASGTGTISNVNLNGTSYSNVFALTGLGSHATAFGAIGGGDTNFSGGGTTAFTDLTISAITAAPEPSTYALLAGGALVLGAYQYRRRQQYGI